MKTLILTIAVGAAYASALAQGSLNFANVGGGVNAPVTDVGGDALNGPGFVADLLYWPKGSASPWLLGQPAPFWTNGFFTGGERVINGAAAGDTITVKIVVWDVADSPYWNEFLLFNSPTAWAGESAPFSVTLSSTPYPPSLPASLTGLRPFTVGVCLSCPRPRPPRPSLSVSRDSNQSKDLLFSWPAYPEYGYVLQQNPDLNPTHWFTVTNQSALVGLTNGIQFQIQLRLPPPSGTMFYRLAP